MAALEKVYANQEEIEPSHRWTDHIKRLLLRLGPDLRRPNADDPFVVQHRLRGSAFSHVSDHTYVDVSGRREPRDHFRAVHVAEGLIARAGHLTTHGIRVYLVIAFGDALCLWEYNPDQYEVRYSGVMDEKTPKIKSYVSVPLKFLSTIITKEDADRESKESHEPGIHHVQAVQQVAAEDAGRDHPAQQEEGQEAGQGQGQEA
jgi:hypothetical protein